jgi:hypothetical protein
VNTPSPWLAMGVPNPMPLPKIVSTKIHYNNTDDDDEA